jgi:hypothetical protein
MRYSKKRVLNTQPVLVAIEMLKQLRWNQTVGGDIITTLDNIQLASGFVTPSTFEKTDRPIDYIDNGWILDLQR